MYTMKKLLLVIGFCWLALSSIGQKKVYDRSEMCYGVGYSTFKGEIGGKDILIPYEDQKLPVPGNLPGFAASIGYRYRINSFITCKTSFTYGRLRGDDALTIEPYKKNRNIHFRSPLVELSAQLEFSLLRERSNSKLAHGKKMRKFNIYFIYGFSAFYFNPQAQYNGKWYDLQPLGTEGQGLNGKEKYSRISYAHQFSDLHSSNIPMLLPSGVAMKFQLSEKVGLHIEWGLRRTFTDYMDDVSTTYYDKEKIRAASGDAAAYFSNPTSNSIASIRPDDPDVVTATGQQRGNPGNFDKYAVTLISLNYKL